MKAGYAYPIETLKHWYVAPIDGLSMDLDPDQIGLNREALADNTDLVPYQDRVSLSKLDGSGSRPFLLKKYFDVVLSIKLAPMPYPNPRTGKQSCLTKRLGTRMVSGTHFKWANSLS